MSGVLAKDRKVNKDFETIIHAQEMRLSMTSLLFRDFGTHNKKDVIRQKYKVHISDVGNVISDEFSMWLYSVIVDASKVDVSGLTDEEVQGLMNGVFNSIDYRKADFERKGEKYIAKSLDIGDQASQISGVFYPTPIDNYVKIVRQHKMYDRYMDDFAIMHKDKEYLLETLERDI